LDDVLFLALSAILYVISKPLFIENFWLYRGNIVMKGPRFNNQ